MLIQKLKHKLTPQLQKQLNSDIEFSNIISVLAKHCASIYKQMQTTNWIRKKAKSSIKVQTAANIFLRAVICSSRALTVFNNNTFFSHLSNTLWETTTLTTRNLDAETLWLMKEGRCFNYKGKGHIILNCPENAKISAIINISDVNDIENIDQRKK